jgi:hypothetical protein
VTDLLGLLVLLLAILALDAAHWLVTSQKRQGMTHE